MTCSERRVEREEGSRDRWKDTAFSAKSSLILSVQISIPISSISLPPIVTAHSVTAVLIYPLIMYPSIDDIFSHHPSLSHFKPSNPQYNCEQADPHPSIYPHMYLCVVCVSVCAAVPVCRPGCIGCSQWRYQCCIGLWL